MTTVQQDRLLPSVMMGSVRARVAPEPDVVRAVEDLYRRDARSLLGMLCVLLGDRADAEDVLQEAFARLQRSWNRIEDPARASAYLRSIAFNLARSGLRRRRRRPDPPRRSEQDVDAVVIVHLDEVGDRLVLREDQRRLLAALAALPRRQRECVVLRYHAGAGIDEIATTLGVSSNSVKTHLQRALAALRHHLGEGR
jgi:RNA polymerase sigma factor (sigma-70 family)